MSFETALADVHWLGHASFRIDGPEGLKIYIDPYKLKTSARAGVILITHAHYDHCSPEDVSRIASPDTIIMGPASIAGKLTHPVRVIAPGKKVSAAGIVVEAVAAYNPDKKFHPRADGNLGYIITAGGIRICHAGDTDFIPEMKDIKADIALLPVGGTYTMNPAEAAKAAEIINPAVAVPMHYGTVVGSSKDAEEFKRLCKVNVQILKAEE